MDLGVCIRLGSPLIHPDASSLSPVSGNRDMEKQRDFHMNQRKTIRRLGVVACGVLLVVGSFPSVAGTSGTRNVFGQPTPSHEPLTLDPGTPGSLGALLDSPTQPVLNAEGDLFITNFGDGSTGGITVVARASAGSVFSAGIRPVFSLFPRSAPI